MTPDEQHCVERLRWHEDRLSKLLQILGGATFVARRDDDMFRGFYREIKRDLKDEYAAGEAKGVALSKPERVWLQPPLSEAHTALVASPNGRPIGRQLLDGVLEAHGKVHDGLVELKRRLDHAGNQENV